MNKTEPCNGLPAYVRDSMRRFAVALAHFWIVQFSAHCGQPPPDAKWVSWVYKRDIGFEPLHGKRIKVTIELEDDPT